MTDPGRPRVITDPAIRWGEPNVRGISVAAITERLVAGDGMDQILADFGFRREDVLVACWWDAVYGPRKRRELWRHWATRYFTDMARGNWAKVVDPPEVQS